MPCGRDMPLCGVICSFERDMAALRRDMPFHGVICASRV